MSGQHPEDDHRLGANAGLVLPATLARRLGLPELVQQRLDLGDATGRANTGDKRMTLVASALAGGDCIDDADALRTGGTARVLGFTAKAPPTLGAFLRSFRWGHVRQLDGVGRQLLARAWQTGAGPGDAPFPIDLDSTICETYGMAKEGAATTATPAKLVDAKPARIVDAGHRWLTLAPRIITKVSIQSTHHVLLTLSPQGVKQEQSHTHALAQSNLYQ